MEQAPVIGLVLAGGGSKGSYQVGVYRALLELGIRPNIITGTSVGSLNGAMFALDEYETAEAMWLTLRSRDVMTLPEEGAGLSELQLFVRRIISEGGLDVSPLEGIVDRVLDEQALRASLVDFGLVTVDIKGLRAVELPLSEIPEGMVKDYLMASAACFPFLQSREIDGRTYLDGGYSDNMPRELARRMGAEELICVDLEGIGITRPNHTGLPTVEIGSHWWLGRVLVFDPDTSRRNMALGYYDTLRAYGRLRGCAYGIVREHSVRPAEALHRSCEYQLVRLRLSHPAVAMAVELIVTRGGFTDAPLALLEAAAEEAGVSPEPLYTVETLCEAFCKACPVKKLEPMFSLWEDGWDAQLSARATVAAKLVLQALVYRALTQPIRLEEHPL